MLGGNTCFAKKNHCHDGSPCMKLIKIEGNILSIMTHTE